MLASPAPLVAAPAPPGTRLTAATRWIVDICSVLAAATRAARAVESRRQPYAADLKVLGITGPLPKAW